MKLNYFVFYHLENKMYFLLRHYQFPKGFPVAYN